MHKQQDEAHNSLQSFFHAKVFQYSLRFFFILNLNLIQFYASLLFLFAVYTFKLTKTEFIKQSFLISKNKLWKLKLVSPTVKRARVKAEQVLRYSVQTRFIMEEEKSALRRAALHFDDEAFV